jgi:hypothetical protein
MGLVSRQWDSWLSLWTVWPSHSQIPFHSTAILALGKARSRREPNLGCKGVKKPAWCDSLPPKNLYEFCRTDRRIVVTKLNYSLGHCECDGHRVHKVSQRRLTADWLAPRESDCSRMHSKVFYVCVPNYINATRPVFKIFKMDRYFLDSLLMCLEVLLHVTVTEMPNINIVLFSR